MLSFHDAVLDVDNESAANEDNGKVNTVFATVVGSSH